MTPEEHKERHVQLHKYLDELLADFIVDTGKLPSKTTILDFLNWSYQQTLPGLGLDELYTEQEPQS